MSTNETATDGDGNPVLLGPVGQEIVFENDDVRVWEITLDPGANQAWHRHNNPYLVIALEEARNRIDSLAGETRLVHEDIGGVVYRDPGEVHMLTNHGLTRYRSRLIELKFLGESQEGAR